MCKANLINTNSFGCVMSCVCCSHIQVGFGNVMCVFNRKGFLNFTTHVNNLFMKHYAELMTNGNKIFLNTDTEDMFLALNADELKELGELLSGAEMMMQVNRILYPEKMK